MRPLPHQYAVRLRGGPSGYAELTADGLPSLRAAPPVQYDGPGDAWSPEHLLLASLESCFLFTLRAVARLSKVEFLAVDLDASGVVDREVWMTRFTDIVLRATVTVAPGTDRQRVAAVLEKTEKACLVTASLSTPVRMEAEIREVEAAVIARLAG